MADSPIIDAVNFYNLVKLVSITFLHLEVFFFLFLINKQLVEWYFKIVHCWWILVRSSLLLEPIFH